MAPEDSLSHTQEPATGPCPETHVSHSTPSHSIFYIIFNIIIPCVSRSFLSGLGENNEIYISLQERDNFVWELSQCHLPNRVAGDNLSDAVQLWREGLLTNWEYLTQLNKMAGRSYNDLMQYPVFPFVLADYTSQMLDLTDPQAYRYVCALIMCCNCPCLAACHE